MPLHNASTDATEALCRRWQASGAFASMSYRRAERNLGADTNYFSAVALAKTEYCILFGSDDAFLPAAAGLLSAAIVHGVDVAIFSRSMFSHDLARHIQDETFWRRGAARQYQLDTGESYDDYFRQCTSLAAAFSYISVILFRRALWVDNERVRGFIGSAYAHVAALFEGMRGPGRKACRLEICDEPLVKCRTGGDSFLSQGHLKRYMLDWDGYERLSATYFGDCRYGLAMVLRYQNTFRNLAPLRYHLRDDASARAYVSSRLRASAWGRRAWLKWRLLEFVPVVFFKAAYSLKKAYR
jgi:abequosyltransferase